VVTKQKLAEMLAAVAEMTHKTISEAATETWFKVIAMADPDDEALEAAFIRYMMTGDDWPSPAKILALVDEHRGGLVLTAGEAFAIVAQAVRRFGSYQPAEGMAVLDGLTRAALKSCGGWGWACNLGANNRDQFAGRFERAYNQLAQRESVLRRTPEQVRPAIHGGDTKAIEAAKSQGFVQNGEVKRLANVFSVPKGGER
jgi:hypothetical protein